MLLVHCHVYLYTTYFNNNPLVSNFINIINMSKTYMYITYCTVLNLLIHVIYLN